MSIEYHAQPIGLDGITIAFYRSKSFEPAAKAICTNSFAHLKKPHLNETMVNKLFDQTFEFTLGSPRIMLAFGGPPVTDERRLDSKNIKGMVAYQRDHKNDHIISALSTAPDCLNRRIATHNMWAAMQSIQNECGDRFLKGTQLELTSAIGEDFYARFGFKLIKETEEGLVMQRYLDARETLDVRWTWAKRGNAIANPALNAA